MFGCHAAFWLERIRQLLRLLLTLRGEVVQVLVFTDRRRILNLQFPEFARDVRRMNPPCLFEVLIEGCGDLRTAHFTHLRDSLQDAKKPNTLLGQAPTLKRIAVASGVVPELKRRCAFHIPRAAPTRQAVASLIEVGRIDDLAFITAAELFVAVRGYFYWLDEAAELAIDCRRNGGEIFPFSIDFYLKRLYLEA